MKQGNKLIFFVIVLFVVIEALLTLKPTGLVVTGVGILDQAEAIMYEDNINDTIFQIALTPDNNWYSYNGTYDGNNSGYDTGNYSDGITQTFTLENTGSETIDVLLASEDLTSNGNYLDVNMTNGDFQVYIPTVGWKNVPDNSDGVDGSKDSQELCIAIDLHVGYNVTGFDFRIRGSQVGTYVGIVAVTAYSNETINPCTTLGDYVLP